MALVGRADGHHFTLKATVGVLMISATLVILMFSNNTNYETYIPSYINSRIEDTKQPFNVQNYTTNFTRTGASENTYIVSVSNWSKTEIVQKVLSANDICKKSDTSDYGYLPTYEQLVLYNSTTRLLYNRVPKCGSTTITGIFRSLSKTNNFQYPGESGHLSRLTLRNTRMWAPTHEHLLKMLQYIMTNREPWLYSCHIHFTDFSKVPEWKVPGQTSPQYINVVRDPLDRLVSLYYYYRFGFPRPMEDWQRNMTYDECVERRLAECVGADTTGWFTLVPFFCGHEPFCREPSRAALRQAQQNVAQQYTVIGVLSRLPDFLAVSEFLLPQYFRGATSRIPNLKKKKVPTATLR